MWFTKIICRITSEHFKRVTKSSYDRIFGSFLQHNLNRMMSTVFLFNSEKEQTTSPVFVKYEAYSRQNCEVQHDEKGHKALVSLPELNSDDIDRTGNLAAWRILHWFTTARFAAQNNPCPKTGVTFLEYNKMTADMYTFFIGSRMTISKKLYELVNGNVLTSQPPLFDVSFQLGYIGASSLSSVGVMTNRKTGEEVARNVNQVALLSKQTRQVTAVPEDWKLKYSSAAVESQRLFIAMEPVPTGDDVCRYDLRVRWNDTDAYKHTNYLSYVRFCFDAAQDAVANGTYSSFHGDILCYGVKFIETLYKAESCANDVLSVMSWEDKSNPYKLHFSMQKNDGPVIFQSRIEFYPLDG